MACACHVIFARSVYPYTNAAIYGHIQNWANEARYSSTYTPYLYTLLAQFSIRSFIHDISEGAHSHVTRSQRPIGWVGP